jgi:hypothetical protein
MPDPNQNEQLDSYEERLTKLCRLRGDIRAALKALLIANSFLEHQLELMSVRSPTDMRGAASSVRSATPDRW